MARIISIDPGLRGCGVAVFDNGTLRTANYIANPDTKGRGPAAWATMANTVTLGLESFQLLDDAGALVLEMPRVYPGVRREDPNDLLDLAGVDGALTTAINLPVMYYFPADWKAQVPKKEMTARITRHLSSNEAFRVAHIGHKDHNTLDAIGIGLFHLGRMKRGGAK